MVQAQDRRRSTRRDRPGDDLVEKVVAINRVAKVVKGGRRFSFSAIMVVGDGNGRVGMGIGRANEVPAAIRKGATIARGSMLTVPLRNGTIPHPLTIDFGAARVMMKPAGPGTGVIAGGGVRAIMEAAGVRNVLTKSLGSNNLINVVRATMLGLQQLRDPRLVRQERLRLAGRIPMEELPRPSVETVEHLDGDVAVDINSVDQPDLDSGTNAVATGNESLNPPEPYKGRGFGS